LKIKTYIFQETKEFYGSIAPSPTGDSIITFADNNSYVGAYLPLNKRRLKKAFGIK